MVHGEQGVILHKPLPTQATITSTSKISNIYDKGKAALVILETTALDTSDGLPVSLTSVSCFFVMKVAGVANEDL